MFPWSWKAEEWWEGGQKEVRRRSETLEEGEKEGVWGRGVERVGGVGCYQLVWLPRTPNSDTVTGMAICPDTHTLTQIGEGVQSVQH